MRQPPIAWWALLALGCCGSQYKEPATHAAAAESQQPQQSGPYLGQQPPENKRIIFAPGIVSTGFNEHGISFTPNGQEVYYRLLGEPHGIMVTMSAPGANWSEPTVASFSGRYDAKGMLAPDGNAFVLSSGSPPTENGPPLKNWTIWLVKRTGAKWGAPQNIPHLIGSHPTISNHGTIYFYSVEENNRGDVYRSVRTGNTYGPAQKLPVPINTEHWENDPYIAPDESYLIFQSTRPGTMGKGDLFISYQLGEGRWTEPKNLGEGINSPDSGEGCPWVTPDGKYLFFSSGTWSLPNYSVHPITLERKLQILSAPGHGSEDIFWVSARFIENWRPNRVK